MVLSAIDCSAPGAAVRFRRSLAATGCAVVVNHPVPAARVRAVYDEWLAFFETDAKHRYAAGDDRPDGYFPPPEKPAAGGFVPDRKEFFHVYPRGSYPAEVSDAALRYLDDALALVSTLLGWLADDVAEAGAGLLPALPQRLSEDLGATVLRVQRYLPGAGGETPTRPRAVAHTDIDLLTLMPTPSAPGLQFHDGDGWADVPAEPGALVVQAGEMLQLASGGRYPALLHRVVHQGDAAEESRMSLPLFVHPGDDVELGDGVTAAEFRFRRMTEARARQWNVVAGGARRPPVAGPDRGRRAAAPGTAE